jgi:crotonobetaine/carnitine-CoA ligase
MRRTRKQSRGNLMSVASSISSVLSPLTIAGLLDACVRENGERVYCCFGDERVTVAALADRVNRFANGLLALGLRRGDRVAVMLPNHPDYVVAFLAMARIGICQVPVNINLRGASMEYLVEHSALRGFILDARFRDQVLPVLRPDSVEFLISRGGPIEAASGRSVGFDEVMSRGAAGLPPVTTTQSDTLLISYTSGTTGVPKGVLVSDKMLQASGWAASQLADVSDGDVLYLWEPIYHIGGCEVLILGLLKQVTLALVERFSVSKFWDEARGYGATHIHFFGGVLPLLLKEPPSARDRDHRVRIAWGGGCPISIWQTFQERFGVRIRECYGMTEASSFTTLNTDEKLGAVGKPLPYFEVRIADENGRSLPPGQRGEILVRETEPGVIMKEYFRNPEATASALAGGWLHTGDLGSCDDEGFFYYAGRKKDSLRRRGENVSAWEVERVINEHPAVAESAVIGVDNELSDQDIKAFIRLKPGQTLAPLDLIKWCEPRMPNFQLPRFVALIDSFPKTPTERIRKELLPRGNEGAWDLDASGYKPNRPRPAS